MVYLELLNPERGEITVRCHVPLHAEIFGNSHIPIKQSGQTVTRTSASCKCLNSIATNTRLAGRSVGYHTGAGSVAAKASVGDYTIPPKAGRIAAAQSADARAGRRHIAGTVAAKSLNTIAAGSGAGPAKHGYAHSAGVHCRASGSALSKHADAAGMNTDPGRNVTANSEDACPSFSSIGYLQHASRSVAPASQL